MKAAWLVRMAGWGMAGLLFWGGVAGAGLPEPGAGVVRVTLFVTTDVHGSVRRTPGVYAEHNKGSLLACATLMERERGETMFPPLLLDCGDIIQGTEESARTGGGVMARLYNAMGYDAFVVGNHEFDWGTGVLHAFLEQMEATPLAANMQVPSWAEAGLRRIVPYVVREVGGLRVAIVGLTTPNIPNWYPPHTLEGLFFLPSVRTLEAVLPRVNAEAPDLRILLVHQGLRPGADDGANEVHQICETFREFDVVLGGHLHWVNPGTEILGTMYAQGGSGGEGFLRVDLDYDVGERRLEGVHIRYIPVTGETPEDTALAAEVGDTLRGADETLGEVLTEAPERIAPGEPLSGVSGVQTLLAAAFGEASGADIVLHGILSDQAIRAGPVRVADAWRLVPHENDIYTVRLTAQEIRAALEESACFAGTSRQFVAAGLCYTIDPDAPEGRKILHMRTRDGKPLHGRKRYLVALSSYHLSSGGGRFPVLSGVANAPVARAKKVGRARDLLVDYLRRHRPLTVEIPADVRVERGARPERERYR